MATQKYVGVDGCKGGWIFVAIGPEDSVEFGVFENGRKIVGDDAGPRVENESSHDAGDGCQLSNHLIHCCPLDNIFRLP